MNGSTYLTRRDGRYYFRQKVPDDLISVVGKSEIKCSLGTSDKREARELVKVKALEVERMFSAAREQVAQQGESTSGVRTDSGRLASLKAAVYQHKRDELQAILDADPLAPYRRRLIETCPITGDEYCDSDLGMGLEEEIDRWATAVRFDMEDDRVEVEIDDLLRQYSPQPLLQGRDQDAIRSIVAESVLDAMLQFRDGLRGRLPADTLRGHQDGPTLQEVFENWKAERKPPKKTEMEFARFVARFEALNGAIPVSAIEKAHVRTFKEDLRARPGRSGATLAPASVNKAIQGISAVLGWSVDNGFRADNPATGMRVTDSRAEKEKRLPFDPGDLQAIFGSPVFTQGDRPKAGCGEAAFWLPLLALYTGARLEELGQLLVTDVREESNIAYLDLNTIEEGKRLKTQGSRRKIPLHPEVIRLGFLEYARRTRTAGHQQLLPLLKRDSREILTGNWSKWFGRYLRTEIGITNRLKVFHSFRHTFKDACRRARIPEDIHDALTGHASQSVARNYGGEYPLQVLKEAIGNIRYDGLEEFPRVSTASAERQD